MDTARIPLGDRALQRILAHVVAAGDEAETNYLEIKSHLDLNTKEAVAKVAKFLLGVANRDPQTATRHFQGYAVLVIGAQKDEAKGIERGTEAHDLENRLRPYLGAQFPSFEVGRISVADNEVLFIIAPPPQQGQSPFPCRKNFQGAQPNDNLADGAIYVRGASNTRPATSGEIDALVKRALGSGKAPINLDVGILGPINRVTRVDELMTWLYEVEAENFGKVKAIASAKLSPAALFGGGLPVTAEDRAAELVRWQRKRPQYLGAGRAYLLGVALPAASIHVVSRDRFIAKPQLTVTFHQCQAVACRDVGRPDWSKVVEPVIRHRTYGIDLSRDDQLDLMRTAGYPVAWGNRGEDVVVELTPDSFRPNVPWTSDRDDYVLIAREPDATTVKVTWVLTEDGNDATTTGELTLDTSEPVDAADLVAGAFRRTV